MFRRQFPVEIKKMTAGSSEKETRQNLAALDYRRYLPFKILTRRSNDFEVGGWKLILVLTTVATMGIGSLASAALSNDGNQLLENLKLALLESMIFSAALNEYYSQESYSSLIEYIANCKRRLRYDLAEEINIMTKAHDTAEWEVRFNIVVFAVNFPSMLLTRSVMDGLSGQSWKKLPIPWVLPSPDSDYQFFSVLILQVTAIGFSHCLGIIAMCFSTITTQIVALYDVLLLGLHQIETRAMLKMKTQKLGYKESMLLCLRDSVEHLDELVQVVSSERDHLQTTFLLNSLHISLIMACEAFPLLKEGCTIGTAIKGIVFLMVQIFCTFVICNRMEIMSDKTTEVFHALYNTPWYTCDVEYRKMLLNGLTLTRQPLTIRGKFLLGLTAARATFYSSIVNAFNLLKMLRQLD